MASYSEASTDISNTDVSSTDIKRAFWIQSPYLRGVFWFVLSLVISCLNDFTMKFLGQNLPCVEIIFGRFLFAALSLVPFMLYYGAASWKSERPFVHISRGALLFFGVTLWCYGLTAVPIATVTVLSFSVPLFTLVLAQVFLKEHVGWQRLTSTLVGFTGVLVVLQGTSDASFSLPIISIALLVAALMFASLDVINKKFVLHETILSMLFFSALVTLVISAVPTFIMWQAPTLQQILVLMALGIGANLLLYCLLKAFAAADASALAPFRYLELVISMTLGFLFFSEIPPQLTFIGAAIIIPSTFFVARYEMSLEKAKS